MPTLLCPTLLLFGPPGQERPKLRETDGSQGRRGESVTLENAIAQRRKTCNDGANAKIGNGPGLGHEHVLWWDAYSGPTPIGNYDIHAIFGARQASADRCKVKV